MSDDIVPRPPDPADSIDDNDRAPALQRVQHAVGEDVLPFGELDDRFDAIYAASTRAELDAVVADLPAPAAPLPVRPVAAHPAPRTSFVLAGDLEVRGAVSVSDGLKATNIIGDTTIDLSEAELGDDVVITINSVIGDTTVILPDGVRATLEASTVLGDRKVRLSDPRPGTPIVRVTGFSVIGDVNLYSLSRVPEGIFRRIWKRLSG